MRIALPFLSRPPVIPVLRLAGAIGGARGPFGGGGLSDMALAPLVERAFARRPAAVALIVNSPGGSAAQSSLIAARIRRLADVKKVPVHAFVEDMAASGGYWLACAADDIWADETSLVGSIGVIFASFGFPELLSRHGIERRVITAGRSKSLADPFLPEKPEDVARLRALQEPIHQAFIAHVKARRGPRLDASADLFNADIWTGRQAVDLGLIDGIAHAAPKLRELYGDKARFLSMGRRPGLLRRLTGAAVQDVAGVALEAAETRALWSRHGL